MTKPDPGPIISDQHCILLQQYSKYPSPLQSLVRSVKEYVATTKKGEQIKGKYHGEIKNNGWIVEALNIRNGIFVEGKYYC
jgi:hypothetical protein